MDWGWAGGEQLMFRAVLILSSFTIYAPEKMSPQFIEYSVKGALSIAQLSNALLVVI
jgi:hypothetical protein